MIILNDLSQMVVHFSVWIHKNPSWALGFAFFTAFIESMVGVGLLVPGAIILSVIAAMAGSGLIRGDLLYISTACGALMGDSFNFFIAFFFHHQLPELWPFSKYPEWLDSSKKYFKTHGLKSLLFGRFFGPFRGLVPIACGLMHMNWIHFLIMDAISSVIWSFVYISPGLFFAKEEHLIHFERWKQMIFITFITLIFGYILVKLGLFLYRTYDKEKKFSVSSRTKKS